MPEILSDHTQPFISFYNWRQRLRNRFRSWGLSEHYRDQLCLCFASEVTNMTQTFLKLWGRNLSLDLVRYEVPCSRPRPYPFTSLWASLSQAGLPSQAFPLTLPHPRAPGTLCQASLVFLVPSDSYPCTSSQCLVLPRRYRLMCVAFKVQASRFQASSGKATWHCRLWHCQAASLA